MRTVLDIIASWNLQFEHSVIIKSITLISYDLDGDRYFISINITEYDDLNLKRRGAEMNTQKLIETFQNGVDLLNNSP